MTKSCRIWWRNCTLHADSEITVIDEMEDRLSPLGTNVTKTRELIASLELCHHKADRWVYNIIEAIGTGETTKGLGGRSPGQQHPRETVWQNTCAALSAWCAGSPSSKIDLTIDTIPASQLLASLGKRSALKEWQVQRVIDKIRSLNHFPWSANDPAAQYVWLLLRPSEYDFTYLNQCPDQYREHEEYWSTTARTIIHDRENDTKADLSLALAIDMLWPCHWRFVENLRIVLDAIGGKLDSEQPFAACGRNIHLLPSRPRMGIISNTLKRFYGVLEPGQEVDKELLLLLGNPSEVKKWLAASLDKTIRLQLDPPAELRAVSAMTGPEWIE